MNVECCLRRRCLPPFRYANPVARACMARWQSWQKTLCFKGFSVCQPLFQGGKVATTTSSPVQRPELKPCDSRIGSSSLPCSAQERGGQSNGCSAELPAATGAPQGFP